MVPTAIVQEHADMTDEAMSDSQSFTIGPLADAGERRAIFNVLDSFRQYRNQTHYNCTHRRRQKFYALPQSHQTRLNQPPISFLDTLSAIDDAIDDNADLAGAILDLALEVLGLEEHPSKGTPRYWHDKARSLDLNKAQSTIRQFWRDWSQEGFEAEVKPLLDLIISDLSHDLEAQPSQTRLLLPGAGLGRLLFELCLAGYLVEGNEISYHQLLSSNFVLNTTERANQYKLYPFVGNFNNHTSRQHQLRMVTVPDIHPSTEMARKISAGLPVGEMNMSAGDFITSYSTDESAGSFNAVVTIYFIDTAPNVIRYMETVYHCLAKDGIWINIGPLLWHMEESMNDEIEEDKGGDTNGNGHPEEAGERTGIAEPGAVELTDEEVVALALSMGFKVIAHSTLPGTAGGYMQDPASMLQNRYNCSHWVMRKQFE